MGNIYFTSDFHLFHNKDFIYSDRGFNNIGEMNRALIENLWRTINYDDDLYILGDLMLNEPDTGAVLEEIPGIIHIITGNHDTDKRIEVYKSARNVASVDTAKIIKVGKYRFYLSHYPTLTANVHKPMKDNLISLHGHTHQQNNFLFADNPFVYHVGVDSHDLMPITVEQIIEDIKEQIDYLKKEGETNAQISFNTNYS